MYRLRAKVDLADASESFMSCTAAEKPDEPAGGPAFRDPRLSALGYRLLLPADARIDGIAPFDDWNRRRIALAAPDGSRDMEIGKAILLENNIDLLHGVAWDKGCYTGQELTARTHYRGLIKKRLAPVRIAGPAPAIGTPIVENGVEVGEMRSSSGDLGLALLKLDILRQPRPIAFGETVLVPEPPEYLTRHLEQAPA
jgi:folate-binding protein YgfZ